MGLRFNSIGSVDDDDDDVGTFCCRFPFEVFVDPFCRFMNCMVGMVAHIAGTSCLPPPSLPLLHVRTYIRLILPSA